MGFVHTECKGSWHTSQQWRSHSIEEGFRSDPAQAVGHCLWGLSPQSPLSVLLTLFSSACFGFIPVSSSELISFFIGFLPPYQWQTLKSPLAGDSNSHKSLTLPHFVAINPSVFLAVIFLVFTGFVKWMQLKYLSKYEVLCRGGSHEVSLKPPDDVHVSAGVFVFWS